MAHKVHPKAFRLREINDWDTRGFYKNPAQYLEEDLKVREFLNKKFAKTGIEKIEIERFPGKLNVIISSARPGLIIGRGGEGVETLKKELEKITLNRKIPAWQIEQKEEGKNKLSFVSGKNTGSGKKSAKNKIFFKDENKAKKEVRIEIREVKNPWMSASLSGQMVAQQIERRMPYRRVLKQVLSKIMANKEAQGAKIEISGRLNGNEIARREWLKQGRLPLQTIRAIIDYAKTEAHCTYGAIGIKVWIFKGEKFD